MAFALLEYGIAAFASSLRTAPLSASSLSIRLPKDRELL